jgi:acetyl-CoA carboxylase biotin carboxyl carrier protein
MAEKADDHGEVLDVQKIHYLVRLMKRYDLTDLNVSDGKVQIRLRRRGPESPSVAASPLIHAATSSTVTPQAPAPAPQSTPAASAAAPAGPPSVLIKSPMVGTYYASSAPDSPPFVSVGSVVQPDTTIGIIEAMKVFTDIPAGVSGTIVETLVKNGQPVEFDQPLFRVSPA